MLTKIKYILYFFSLLVIISSCHDIDTNIVHYKSQQWGDTKNNNWVEAMNNPKYENVDVYKGDKFIKIILGNNSYKYKIMSTEKYSDYRMDYNVILNDSKYVLSICYFPDWYVKQGTGVYPNSYSIAIEHSFFIYNAKAITNQL